MDCSFDQNNRNSYAALTSSPVSIPMRPGSIFPYFLSCRPPSTDQKDQIFTFKIHCCCLWVLVNTGTVYNSSIFKSGRRDNLFRSTVDL